MEIKKVLKASEISWLLQKVASLAFWKLNYFRRKGHLVIRCLITYQSCTPISESIPTSNHTIAHMKIVQKASTKRETCCPIYKGCTISLKPNKSIVPKKNILKNLAKVTHHQHRMHPAKNPSND